MFAKRLKELRMNSPGLTQARLAERLGVSQQAVGLWERGNNMPSHELIARLANMFNVSTDYLLDTTSSDEQDGYYTDPEVAEIANRLKDDPDMRILFDASSKLSKDDLQFVIDMVNRMKKD